MAGRGFPLTVLGRRAAALTGTLRAGAGPDEVGRVLADFGEDAAGLDDSALPGLRAVADDLYGVFAAPDAAAWAGRLNAMLRRWCAPPRLSCHDGSAWHIHLDAGDDAPWHEWLAASSAYALAVLLAETGRPPGGICQAAGCDRPYLGTGSGGQQRYCSPRCASRARVAAYRAAHRSRSTASPPR